MTKIKFVNGSTIETIEPDTTYYVAARGCGKSHMVMAMLIDDFKLKWYQKLRLKWRFWLYDKGLL